MARSGRKKPKPIQEEYPLELLKRPDLERFREWWAWKIETYWRAFYWHLQRMGCDHWAAMEVITRLYAQGLDGRFVREWDHSGEMLLSHWLGKRIEGVWRDAARSQKEKTYRSGWDLLREKLGAAGTLRFSMLTEDGPGEEPSEGQKRMAMELTIEALETLAKKLPRKRGK